MKILGRNITLFNRVAERFKGKIVTAGSSYGKRKNFYTGEASWRSRCEKFHHDYETHVLAKQALISIAGQAIAEGIYLQPVTNKDDENYPRSDEAVKKCEELNKRIQIKKLLFDTFFYMAKYGSYFWEKTWTPQFDVRGIPFVEYLEPAVADEQGTITQWRQNITAGSNVTWNSDEIVDFHWNPSSYSYPYGTSMLIGLDNEFTVLEETEDAIRDYSVKTAYPYEIYQMGEGDDKPLDSDIESFAAKLKQRDPGDTFLTTVKSNIIQGGTQTNPMKELTSFMDFIKDNATDGMMIPPLSKLYNSTEASSKQMNQEVANRLIKPMQEIVRIQLMEHVYKPYLEDLGYSIKLCPDILFESPDSAKTETMEFWKGMVEAGICPPVVAAREFGWEDEFKEWQEEEQLKQKQMMAQQQSQGFGNQPQQEEQGFGESWIVTRKPKKTHFLFEEDECTANGGVWRTIRGTHVCIRKGESMDDALKRTLGKDYKEDSDKSDKPKKGVDYDIEPDAGAETPYKIYGQVDTTEMRIISKSLENLPEEDVARVKSVEIVDEADFYDISGERHSADASMNKRTGEMKIERSFLTSPEINRVLFHEVAHRKWDILNENFQYEWKRLFQRGLSNGYKFPSFYATTSPEEAFCEAYAFHKDGRGSSMEPNFISLMKYYDVIK